MDGRETATIEDIRRSCRRISTAATRGEAGVLMAREISSFSLFDLQVIMGRVRYEVHRLPRSYRKVAAPYLLRQVVDAHHRLLSMCTAGEFSRMGEPISEKETFDAYFAMVPEGCLAGTPSREYLPQFHSPRHRLFSYILAGFTMFVLEEPGHPVGTPFPGGLSVTKRDGRFYCPVREKHRDVPFAICNFCPAIQDG